MNEQSPRSFAFVNLQELPPKPRESGLIEIRGPFYEATTTGELQNLLETWGYYIDGFKFAGGTQALLPKETVKRFTSLAHQHQVYVNTGGFIERIVIQKNAPVEDYLQETKELGFDIVEVSSGMFADPADFSLKQQVQIVKKIKEIGLKPKPEITLMSGVGGGTKEHDYQKRLHTAKTVDELLEEGDQLLNAGAYMLMIESEGITEGISDPKDWRDDVIFSLIDRFGIDKLMFEISPEDGEARQAFKWYLNHVSRDVNLMMNAKNIVEFNAWRMKLWGDRKLWEGQAVTAIKP